MRNLICAIILLLILPEVSFAQSKPKRDVSKDNRVIVAIKKQPNKRTIQKRRNSKPTKIQRKRKSDFVEQKATFLTVNKQTSISRTLDAKGGEIYFDISTDGKEWTVTFLPSWCHITKYSIGFIVTYDANTKHEDRQNWIEVRSDDQRARIKLLQSGTPLDVKAGINYAYLQHNQYIWYEHSLKINANVTISGAAGQECWVEAYIVDKHGTNIKASNGYENYALPYSNDIYVKSKVTPSTDSPETFNVACYIPNKALKLIKKKNELQCKLFVYSTGTKSYVDRATYTLKFKAKNKNGRITTSYSQ